MRGPTASTFLTRRGELKSLANDWNEIIRDIERYKIGCDGMGWSDSGFHIIEKRLDNDGSISTER
jgi:hypothetical protein